MSWRARLSPRRNYGRGEEAIFALLTIHLRRKQRFKQNAILLRVVVEQVVKHEGKHSLKHSFNHKLKQVLHRMAKHTSNGKERKGMERKWKGMERK